MIHNQRGGIVSFGIVTLVLLGLLAGGLYVSKHQARVARDSDTTTPQVSTPQKDADTKKEATPAKTKPVATPAKKPATQTPATAPAATPATAPTASVPRVASTGPSSPLPATGPADTALITFSLSILGFTGYQLYRSHRSLQRAALRK